MARDYKKEYKNYHGKPKQKKRRAHRNWARAQAEKKGLVEKGDNNDVHHIETQLIVVGKIFQSVIKAVTDLLLELRQGGKNINVQELY